MIFLKNKINIIIIGILTIVFVMGSGLYFFSTAKTESKDKQTDTGSKNTSKKVIKITAGNYYYSIKEIKVKKGDRVKINLTVIGGTHNFVIDEFNVESDLISGGDTTTVEFVADKVGTFVYYCSMPNHRQLGQAGILTVEP